MNYVRLSIMCLFLCVFSTQYGATKIKAKRITDTNQIQVIIKDNGSDADRKEHNRIIRNDLPDYVNAKIKEKIISSASEKSIFTKILAWFKVKFASYVTLSKKDPAVTVETFDLKRMLGQSGSLYSFSIPKGTSYQEIEQLIHEFCKNHNEATKFEKNFKPLEVETSKVVAIHHAAKEPTDDFLGLEGKYLSLDELESLKIGQLIPRLNHKLKTLNDSLSEAKGEDVDAIKEQIESLKERISDIEIMNKNLFWYQEIPTIGLRPTAENEPCYPFLPHFFPLWELAPKKGAGVKVAVIDTGIAAFGIKGDTSILPNQDLQVSPDIDFSLQNFNVVGKNGEDQLQQFIYAMEDFIVRDKFNVAQLEHIAPVFIKAYLTNKDKTELIAYLKKNGLPELFDANGTLSEKGTAAINEIISGPDGITPSDQPPHFHLVEMTFPRNEMVIAEFLPRAEISNEAVTLVSGHGTHTSGVIGARLDNPKKNIPGDDKGICGIAPLCDLYMIKAFGADGNTDVPTLLSAMKKAAHYDMISMSLKIADNMNLSDETTKLFEVFLSLVPYTVCASGNDGSPKYSENYPGKVISYPGKFDSVIFSVGSISKIGNDLPISIFSQYEPQVGPFIVAPGFNILSTGLIPKQKDPSMYVFMDGTSMAVPIITGFAALVVAEFQHDFTSDELITTAYHSTVFDKAWSGKVLLGTIDMRLALFTLHVLRAAKKQLGATAIPFDNLMVATQTIIFGLVDEYSRQSLVGEDMKQHFVSFITAARKNKKLFNKIEFFKKIGGEKLSDAIAYVTKSLIYCIDPKKTSDKPDISNDLIKSVKEVLMQQPLQLFPNLSKKERARLLETQKTDAYWTKIVQEMKSGTLIQNKEFMKKYGKKVQGEIIEFSQELATIKGS